MDTIKKALQHLERDLSSREQHFSIPFEEFLKILKSKPHSMIRNIFQAFHDMVVSHVGEGVDEYPDDQGSESFLHYDCSRLFVADTDHPFFADRLFANRLIKHVEAMRRSAQQNKIYIFDGPPGCGKSTFLNNLLKKFEKYANTSEGLRFEVGWKLDRKMLGDTAEMEVHPLIQKINKLLDDPSQDIDPPGAPDAPFRPRDINAFQEKNHILYSEDIIEFSCPSHDHPILLIPKRFRRSFLDDLIQDQKFKKKLFTEKEYEWVFKDKPCTICSSLYQALLNKLNSPQKVHEMVYARPYHFNRRLGEGISVFNPGDEGMKRSFTGNPMLQNRINRLIKDSGHVKFIFSPYAKTNNGVYALMDIKSHNSGRLMELHNIVSEGVHKVEHLEENVNSFFVAVMNPEDKDNIKDTQSFSDRIEYINIPYVLDFTTEVEIYRGIFGGHIDKSFLPRVLNNFARAIISTRLKIKSETLLEWLEKPDKYSLYCDENLQLLKMDIYAGYIPSWLTEEDRKRFTGKLRRKIIAESEKEGAQGLSGRDSIKIFNEFYSTYAKDDKLINMSSLSHYIKKIRKDLDESIPKGFMKALLQMYNYAVLQEVKESLYYYNEEQISKNIQNYLFALNFEIGSVETCKFTGEKLEITEEFLKGIEDRLLDTQISKEERLSFRKDTQKKYTSNTLTQEIISAGQPLTETNLYKLLFERYAHNLKEKVLEPFLDNENFRRAIKDYETEDFKTYDKRIVEEVSFMMNNLSEKYGYTKQGAKEICMYVIDSELPKKFADSSKV